MMGRGTKMRSKKLTILAKWKRRNCDLGKIDIQRGVATHARGNLFVHNWQF
jgi:hypothetical protein